MNTKDPETTKKTIDDLMAKTGLDLYLDGEGYLKYTSSEGKGGSKTARKFLLKAIDGKGETIMVENNPNGMNRCGIDKNDQFTNTIFIDKYETEKMIKGALLGGLAETTLGYGITFLHELGHTKRMGARRDIYHLAGAIVTNDNHYIPGHNEQRINRIRRELGDEYGTRESYPWITIISLNERYIPFSKEARTQLLNGLVPTSHYIKFLK